MVTASDGILEPFQHALPFRQVGLGHVQPELLDHQCIELLRVQQHRDAIDVVGVHGRDDRVLRHVGEQGDLAPFVTRQVVLGPAQQDVRLDTDGTQLLDRVLGGLGLDLPGGADVGHQRQVHEQRILEADFHPHLPDRLQKRQRLDVADGAADLDHGDVRIRRPQADAVLDLIGDVRDHLHRAPQIFTTALLADHAFVDLAGGEVVVAPHAGAQKALVVTQIQVGLGTVVGDVDLPVLERAHGAWVDVDVGVELDHRDAEATGLEQRPERRGSNAFTQRRDDAAGDKNKLGHRIGGGRA